MTLRLSGLIILLCSVFANAAVEMPLGIPMPPFGITNTHWMYHPDLGKTWDYGSGAVPYRTNEHGPYVYYVDNTHGSATDTANTYGTPTTPRRTWPFPLAAGAVVMVANGGTYTFDNGASSTMRHGGTGTESDPVFIIGVGATTNVADRPKIDGKAALIQGTWSMFEGFVLTNNATLATRNDLYGGPITNYCVRSNICVGTSAASTVTIVAVSGGSSPNYIANLVVFTNYFANYGNYTNATENDACATIFRDYSTNCWMLYNTVTRMGGDMIRVGSNEDNDLDNCNTGYHYVGRNQTWQNGENAVDVKKANRSVISENICYDLIGYVGGGGGGSAVAIHYNPNYTWFLNNVFHTTVQGMASGTRMQSTNHVYLVGNVFYNLTDSAVYWRAVNVSHHYGNTIYNAVQGFENNVSAIRSTNNLVVDCSSFALLFGNSTGRNNSEMGYDGYYRTGGGNLISWISTHTSVTSWLAEASTGDNSVEGDPLFVDAAGADFRIGESGAATGTGDPDTWQFIEDSFLAQFGFALNYTDRAGNARVDDIGAYEFQSGSRRATMSGGARLSNGRF